MRRFLFWYQLLKNGFRSGLNASIEAGIPNGIRGTLARAIHRARECRAAGYRFNHSCPCEYDVEINLLFAAQYGAILVYISTEFRGHQINDDAIIDIVYAGQIGFERRLNRRLQHVMVEADSKIPAILLPRSRYWKVGHAKGFGGWGSKNELIDRTPTGQRMFLLLPEFIG